jgi:hypothetical protein
LIVQLLLSTIAKRGNEFMPQVAVASEKVIRSGVIIEETLKFDIFSINEKTNPRKSGKPTSAMSNENFSTE